MNDKIQIKEIMQEVFYALGLALAVFVVMELVWPRIVLAYINFSVLVALFLISGIIVIMKHKA